MAASTIPYQHLGKAPPADYLPRSVGSAAEAILSARGRAEEKLQVSGRAAAVARALRAGLIE